MTERKKRTDEQANKNLNQEFVTLEQAAKILGLTKATLYSYTHKRIIPFYKPNGRMIYFKTSELFQFIETSRRSSIDEIQSQAVDTILSR